MFEIRQSIIEDDIPHTCFACDLSACKGACCTIAGGTGAPLLDEELEQIKRSFPAIQSSLPPEHLEIIRQQGLVEGASGSYTTKCFNNRSCVFVFYQDGVARCAFEKAFLEGKTGWRKPISCHLFPIRVSFGPIKHLRYERITECAPAVTRGQEEQIFLSSFLKDPLIRTFGASWYHDFQLACSKEQKYSLIPAGSKK